MKKLLATFVVLAMLVTPVMADVATGEIGAGAAPGDQLPKICVKHRDVIIGYDADPVGINIFDYRTGLYAFAGEQLEYYIAVRDPNGKQDLGPAKIRVDGASEVLCTELTAFPANLGNATRCDGFGALSTGAAGTDRLYICLLTVEPDWYGDLEVKITAYNSAFLPTDGTHTENWFLNPAISMSAATSDGQPIHFEALPYGADAHDERWVHSLNKIKVKNTAEGGVNMWMFIAGTDLFDPSGASLCPVTNKLDLHAAGPNGKDPVGPVLSATDDTGMAYRAWSGTQWTSWEGWVWMEKYDQNKPCSLIGGCYGGTPAPFPDQPFDGENSEVPPLENVLTNQGTMEVEFKLNYPMPCVGTFSQGTIYLFGKAI